MSSQDSASSESPSLLSNLRNFRFQKKILEKLTSSEETPEESSQIGARRRIVRQILESDSEEEEEKGEKKAKEEKGERKVEEEKDEEDVLCTKEEIVKKEKSLNKVIEAFPSTDKMVLQDALIRTDWDAQKAIDRITKENIIGQMKRKLSEVQDVVPVAEPEPARRPAKVRRKDVDKFEEERDDDDDGDEGTEQYNEKVFDSDESDEELPDIVTGDKKRVLEFLSDATAAELRAMPNCSQKKIEAIMEQRPFSGWKDLVEKFQAAKYLGTELLNSAQEVLHMRQQMKALLKKCKKMATRMEKAIANGEGSIKKQPSLIPEGLNLAPYQLVGLNWLVAMHRQDLSGILADEMGLGKTIQVIAFFAFLKESNFVRKGPHLVIVPSSTLENWKNEFELWCPSLRIVRYYGSKEERKMMRVEWAKYGTDDMDVILTTYSTINTPEEKKMFRVLRMHYVVYDEAHMLKNMNSQRYDTFIRINASHRILLTGTPLQNNLLELMSLLMFVMPKMFMGVKDHVKFLFAKVPKQGGNGNEKEDKLPNFEKEQIERAKRIMKPFVLRRLKSNVLKDLPTKTLETVRVPLAESQKEKYDELIKTFAETSGLENAENHMTMMMMLRKMSNHPLLLRYHFKDKDLKELARILVKDSTYKGDNEEYILEDLHVMSDFEIHQLAKSKQLAEFYVPQSLVCKSGKFIKFDELLPDLKRDSHRVLIFSQFVIMLDVMEEYLKIREHVYLRLDGSTPVPERQEMIDKFNNDPTIFVILLSTRAGGVGINLTAADTVIIHDIDFNPYNDKQAEDRCHRLGQSRNVNVLRFISEGTIEEGMYRIAQEKLTLEKEINSEENEAAELKNVASLLKQALGLESSKANHLQNLHS